MSTEQTSPPDDNVSPSASEGTSPPSATAGGNSQAVRYTWVWGLGMAMGVGIGYLAANTGSNRQHITERDLGMAQSVKDPWAPPKMPYDPDFDNEKPFNTPMAFEGAVFGKEFETKVEVAEVEPKFYEGKPRVRYEWRKLSDEHRKMFGEAFRVMVETPTQSGREEFGPLFWNYQDLVAFHVCSVVDPRCDQGHFGPNFITFHTAYMLRIELSLLAVCDAVFNNTCKEEGLGIPYWDVSKDSIDGEYRNDEEKWIFSDNYFGSYYTKNASNFQVTDGLFKNWPIANYTDERFGPNSDMAGPNNYNKVTTCFQEEWFYPGFPDSANVQTISKENGLLDVTKFEANNVKYAADQQEPQAIPPWCSPECHQDFNECPRYFRLDQYSCNPYVTRTVAAGSGNSQIGGGATDMFFTENDFTACTNPKWIRNQMEWMNCVEKRLDGLCEIRPIDPVLSIMSGDVSLDSSSIKAFRKVINATQFQFTQHGAGMLYADRTFTEKSGMILPGIMACGNPQGYYDTDDGRHYVNCQHAMGHIKLGDEMVDTGTSANDVGPFTGLHANLVRSHLQWRVNAEDYPEIKEDYYHYPNDQNRSKWEKHVGELPYGTAGPYGTYDMSYCLAAGVYYRYENRERNGTYIKADKTVGSFSDAYDFTAGPWLNGTLLDEVVSAGYPFYYLFDDVTDDADDTMNKDGGENGYTHKEILYWTMPERTPYTYDTMMHHYSGYAEEKPQSLFSEAGDESENSSESSTTAGTEGEEDVKTTITTPTEEDNPDDGAVSAAQSISSMSVTAAALAWGSMAVTMMWFVMG